MGFTNVFPSSFLKESHQNSNKEPCFLGLKTSKTKCQVSLHLYFTHSICKIPTFPPKNVKIILRIVNIFVSKTTKISWAHCTVWLSHCHITNRLEVVFIIKQMMHSCYTQFKLHKSTSLPWQLEAHGWKEVWGKKRREK